MYAYWKETPPWLNSLAYAMVGMLVLSVDFDVKQCFG